jgi:hypothetical protein
MPPTENQVESTSCINDRGEVPPDIPVARLDELMVHAAVQCNREMVNGTSWRGIDP